MGNSSTMPARPFKTLRAIGKAILLHPTIQPRLQELLRHLITQPRSRSVVNALYQQFSHSPRFALIFFDYCSNLFRESDPPLAAGSWSVTFAGKSIRLPLQPDRTPTDWNVATSVLGHDSEIKQTYAALLQSDTPPDLFVDIGGNLGTHSLLWLSHNIETLTFEPNVSCHGYFQEACTLNGVTPQIECVALGATRGTVELYYPEGETWLGSTHTDLKDRIHPNQTLVVQPTPQKTLDDYRSKFAHRRLLIKIDTEGNEQQVLQGGRQTLQDHQPLVIFECWYHEDSRKNLFEFFAAQNYGISNLPWFPGQATQFLDLTQLIESPFTNFIALPKEVA